MRLQSKLDNFKKEVLEMFNELFSELDQKAGNMLWLDDYMYDYKEELRELNSRLDGWSKE